jgi:hypothetical protein
MSTQTNTATTTQGFRPAGSLEAPDEARLLGEIQSICGEITKICGDVLAFVHAYNPRDPSTHTLPDLRLLEQMASQVHSDGPFYQLVYGLCGSLIQLRMHTIADNDDNTKYRKVVFFRVHKKLYDTFDRARNNTPPEIIQMLFQTWVNLLALRMSQGGLPNRKNNQVNDQVTVSKVMRFGMEQDFFNLGSVEMMEKGVKKTVRGDRICYGFPQTSDRARPNPKRCTNARFGKFPCPGKGTHLLHDAWSLLRNVNWFLDKWKKDTDKEEEESVRKRVLHMDFKKLVEYLYEAETRSATVLAGPPERITAQDMRSARRSELVLGAEALMPTPAPVSVRPHVVTDKHLLSIEMWLLKGKVRVVDETEGSNVKSDLAQKYAEHLGAEIVFSLVGAGAGAGAGSEIVECEALTLAREAIDDCLRNGQAMGGAAVYAWVNGMETSKGLLQSLQPYLVRLYTETLKAFVATNESIALLLAKAELTADDFEEAFQGLISDRQIEELWLHRSKRNFLVRTGVKELVRIVHEAWKEDHPEPPNPMESERVAKLEADLQTIRAKAEEFAEFLVEDPVARSMAFETSMTRERFAEVKHCLDLFQPYQRLGVTPTREGIEKLQSLVNRIPDELERATTWAETNNALERGVNTIQRQIDRDQTRLEQEAKESATLQKQRMDSASAAINHARREAAEAARRAVAEEEAARQAKEAEETSRIEAIAAYRAAQALASEGAFGAAQTQVLTPVDAVLKHIETIIKARQTQERAAAQAVPTLAQQLASIDPGVVRARAVEALKTPEFIQHEDLDVLKRVDQMLVRAWNAFPSYNMMAYHVLSGAFNELTAYLESIPDEQRNKPLTGLRGMLWSLGRTVLEQVGQNLPEECPSLKEYVPPRPEPEPTPVTEVPAGWELTRSQRRRQRFLALARAQGLSAAPQRQTASSRRK